MTTPPPAVPARVVEALRGYKHALLFTPRLEQQAERAVLAAIADAIAEARRPVDPREPDPTRTGFWALHNCAGCENGKWDCITDGGYRDCPGPQARND